MASSFSPGYTLLHARSCWPLQATGQRQPAIETEPAWSKVAPASHRPGDGCTIQITVSMSSKEDIYCFYELEARLSQIYYDLVQHGCFPTANRPPGWNHPECR
jgi:hypothetical protein